MSKFVVVLVLLISLAGCGTITNWRNPSEINTKEEMDQALRLGLIKGYNRYIVGNLLIAIPTLGGGILGLFLDYWTNSNYKVIDKPAYEKWLQKRQEKVQQERAELLGD